MDGLSRGEGAGAEPRRPLEGRRPLHDIFRPTPKETDQEPAARPAGGRIGLGFALAVLVLYSAAVVVATYPRITMMRGILPGYRVDPLQHIWVMNWYKSCLLEGKAHVFSPDIQYPTGAPLANFSPMLFQSLFFIPLSTAIGDDILAYNILWFAAYLFSGFSVFRLAWTSTRDRAASTFAGLAGMLCTPMMLRGFGHLELMCAGSMCLFLSSWMAWVDRPTRRGLFAAAGLYATSALCAAYFAVFAVVPAVIFAAWRLVGSGPGGAWPWLRARLGWFAAFLALVVPALLLTFSAQIWAVSRGISMHRSLAEFERYGAPLWSYVVPTIWHPLDATLQYNAFDPLGYPEVECASYLGLVTLALCGYSAIRRVSFANSRFLWATFAILAVLSMGGSLRMGGYRVPMPGLWLRQYVPIFQSIRSPGRFNLPACGIAAVLAGAGLGALLSRMRRPWARAATFSAAVVLLVADLSMVPFPVDPLRPEMPACYAWLREQDPNAALLELPLLSSGCNHPLNTTCAYWQSSHKMKTSAGYSGFANAAFDDLLVDDAPWSTLSLLGPFSLERPDSLAIGIVPEMSLKDYAWMVAATHRFDYILLHRWDDTINERHLAFARLASVFHRAAVFGDKDTFVYDARKLERPTRPALLCEGGWRAWRERVGPPMRVAEKSARISVYVPESPNPPVVLAFEAGSLYNPRRVALRKGHDVLARWEVAPGAAQGFATPPLDLPPGLHTLALESDSDEKPTREEDQASSWDVGRYSLLVRRLEIRAANP